MSICSLGKHEQSTDGKVLCSGSLIDRQVVGDVNLRLVKIRSGIKRKKKNICQFHFKKWIESYASHQTCCSNPFSLHTEVNGIVKAKGSQEISLEIRDKAKGLGLELIPGRKLCVKCKVQLYKMLKEHGIVLPLEVESSPSIPSSSQMFESPALPTPPSQTKTESPYIQPATPSCVEVLNEWLVRNGEEPIDLIKVKKQNLYLVQQMDKIKKILESFAGKPSESSTEVECWFEKSLLFDEMLNQLQNYFQSCPNNSAKVQALSVLPKSFSTNKIKKYFNASSRIVRKTKALVDTKGIFCTPNKKLGRALRAETHESVKQFFYRQDVSKELAGKTNVISVKENGEKIHKRKRLVLANLSHLHEEFCKAFPENPISRSKFAFLRPRECVLAGSSGMHNVCVCTIHENPKLMFNGANLKRLLGQNSVTDCLKMLTCSPATPACCLRECNGCPDSSELREKLEVAFDEDMIDTVTFNQWLTADRSDIITQECDAEEFINAFITKLEDLVPHHFIFKSQASFFINLQNDLQATEVIVVGDFAENYAFIVQDSAQGFYFSNRQATIHPFSCYFKDSETSKKMQISCAVISEYMDHSTTAVHAFLKILLTFLKQEIPNLTKVYYFSDGAAAQYKNKFNAANVWFHHSDFGVDCEWHFFATSHGKSACDGIGGTVKRLASLFSLQHTEPGAQITSPKRLFEWAASNIKGIRFMWASKEDVCEAEKYLEVRFKTAYPIDGIQSAHVLIPSKQASSITIKRYSSASTGEVRNISTRETELNFHDVKGFVTIMDKETLTWHLAYVEEACEKTSTFKLLKLQKTSDGKKNCYQFSDEIASIYPLDSVLTLTQPMITARGRVIKLRASEAKAADIIVNKKQSS